jgi:beta-N-acetylhexosaminidase
MTARAFITGIAGPIITPAERAFLRESDPWGLILFRRNVETPAQVARLTASFRDTLGRDAAVLIDQEGGRVQRLEPPHWPAYPAAAAYGKLYDFDAIAGRRAAQLGARLIAADLIGLGIDVDCLPVADVPVAGANSVIGDRAYGERPDVVSVLARSAADGLMAGGVLPVVKHMPGHGRATADSHHGLPVVETSWSDLDATDFAAFRPLSDLPLGMTAHVVYSAIDPIAPATTSVTVVWDVIRGRLGFRGLLMSDDISMGALSGSIGARSRAALAAGCDIVLHCNGELDEAEAVAAEAPRLDSHALTRAAAALQRRGQGANDDIAAVRAEWAMLMAMPAAALRTIS